MEKHTSGPWILDTISGWTDGSKRDLNGDIYIRKEGDALPFGQIFTDTEEREMLDSEIIPERIANARLMAAAPDLLEALEEITASYEKLLKVSLSKNNRQKLAIAKAKGGK